MPMELLKEGSSRFKFVEEPTGEGDMQQTYQCPNCGAPVAFGVRYHQKVGK